MRPRPTVETYPNRADPAADVKVTIRPSRLGIMPPGCTWFCTGCFDGDDQPQALKWARLAARRHALRCDSPPRIRYVNTERPRP